MAAPGSRSRPTLGVDVGGVVIDHAGGGTDIDLFADNFLATPVVPGAFDALAAFNALFDGRVHLVSKARERGEGRARRWLFHHRFSEATGITPERWHFVRARADKAAACRELGITHFVDDRLEVHATIAGTVGHRYLFRPSDAGYERDEREWGFARRGLTLVRSWDELRLKLHRPARSRR